jgi:biopolymer transport protein ExbD
VKIRRHETRKARIEIIPMIDVVFFLLVFSLLTNLTKAEINRLEPAVPAPGSGEAGVVNRITVNHIGGNLFLTFETESEKRQQTVTLSEIQPAVAEAYRGNPEIVVLINADDNLTFEEGASLMDAVQQAGPPMVVPAG